MIYFDNNKNAYAYIIPNYIATVEDEIWAQYATTDKWDIVGGEFIDITDTEEYKEKKKKEKEERINLLTITALDLITAIKSVGVTDEQIEQFLNSNLTIKHQLQFCQNVYCGVAKSFCPITIGSVTLLPENMEQIFKTKNGVE